MASAPATGSAAPNFDLRSTEDAVLMLVDEAPRAAQVVYFFGDPADEACRAELRALSEASAEIRDAGGAVMAIAPAKIDDLKAVQKELGLAFPLLRDDRGFSASYGVGEEGAATGLYVVDRACTVAWSARPAAVTASLAEVVKTVAKLPSMTSTYPKSVINRLVDHFSGGA